MNYQMYHSMITGKAGSGKTALITEMLSVAKHKNPMLKVCFIDVKKVEQTEVCMKWSIYILSLIAR